jgi:hypothetical protein
LRGDIDVLRGQINVSCCMIFFFELMLYDFELVVMCIRTCYKFQ